jgi:hypothetical protein
MSESHDWHVFDEESRLEVRRWKNVWQVRKLGTDHPRVNLSDAEFESLREAGPDLYVMTGLNGEG